MPDMVPAPRLIGQPTPWPCCEFDPLTVAQVARAAAASFSARPVSGPRWLQTAGGPGADARSTRSTKFTVPLPSTSSGHGSPGSWSRRPTLSARPGSPPRHELPSRPRTALMMSGSSSPPGAAARPGIRVFPATVGDAGWTNSSPSSMTGEIRTRPSCSAPATRAPTPAPPAVAIPSGTIGPRGAAQARR